MMHEVGCTMCDVRCTMHDVRCVGGTGACLQALLLREVAVELGGTQPEETEEHLLRCRM